MPRSAAPAFPPRLDPVGSHGAFGNPGRRFAPEEAGFSKPPFKRFSGCGGEKRPVPEARDPGRCEKEY